MTAPTPTATCLFCDRTCPGCGYPIDGGFEHYEQPQPPNASHIVHETRRVQRPLVELVILWTKHAWHSPTALLAEALHSRTKCPNNTRPYRECMCAAALNTAKIALAALDQHGWRVSRPHDEPPEPTDTGVAARIRDGVDTAGPEQGHRFHITAASQGSYRVGDGPYVDSGWIGEPFRITLRAWSLSDAMRLAAGLPLSSWLEPGEVVRSCRICGCTEDDCRGCIERTGEPCSWVSADLCSACEPTKRRPGRSDPLAE